MHVNHIFPLVPFWKRFLQVKPVKEHWTTSASSPDFFFIPLDVYTYVVLDCVLNFACNFTSVTKIYHWPQYMDGWLARFCILVNACYRKSLGSHFTPVKTLDRHTDFCTCQCMKCNRWQVFSFKFHENSEKKMEKFPRSSRLLNIYWKLLKKKLLMLINLKFVQY